MMETEDGFLRFTPNRCEGWKEVSEVVIRPDRLAFLSEGVWKTFAFHDIARWPRPVWLWKLLKRYGKGPGWLPVGDRDWFHDEGEKFFIFYTKPELTVYLPAEVDVGYHQSLFRRAQDVMVKGGYSTFDLG